MDKIKNLIMRARELEALQMTSSQEPEIGINEETQMFTISKYDPNMQCAIHLEDFCSIEDIDIDELRDVLDNENIAYVL